MLNYYTMKNFMVLCQIFKKEVMTEVIERTGLFFVRSLYFEILKNFKEVV